MSEEVGPLNVADSEHGEDVATRGWDIPNIVDGVEGYEYGAPEQRDATEQDPRHAGET